MKVVDKRWWARTKPDAEPAEEAPSEPTPTPSGSDDLEQQVAAAQQQLAAVIAEHRRATDEFEQVKVRIRREVARDVERGRRVVLAELLDVLDNLDRAIIAAQDTPPGPEAAATLLRGVELVREQFLSKLEGFGVMQVASLGEPFDPQVHEAVSIAPVNDPAYHGRVVAVATEGYAIGDELLRPATVVVGQHG